MPRCRPRDRNLGDLLLPLITRERAKDTVADDTVSIDVIGGSFEVAAGTDELKTAFAATKANSRVARDLLT